MKEKKKNSLNLYIQQVKNMEHEILCHTWDQFNGNF